MRSTCTSGTTACTGAWSKALPGRGSQLADFLHHLGHVFAIDAAKPCQLGEVAPRQKVEIGEQGLHRRVEPVLLRQLYREAFGQVARANAGRIEALYRCDHALDPRFADAKRRRNLRSFAPQITVVIERIDDLRRNQSV